MHADWHRSWECHPIWLQPVSQNKWQCIYYTDTRKYSQHKKIWWMQFIFASHGKSLVPLFKLSEELSNLRSIALSPADSLQLTATCNIGQPLPEETDNYLCPMTYKKSVYEQDPWLEQIQELSNWNVEKSQHKPNDREGKRAVQLSKWHSNQIAQFCVL